MSDSRIRVTNLDHIVLRTPDVERSLRFYCDFLGLAPERVEEWRNGGAPFPSVRVDASTIIDLFPSTPGRSIGGPAGDAINLDHLCLVVEPTDLAALGDQVDVIEGPVARWGARGMATSVYLHDPDGNVVELRYYG